MSVTSSFLFQSINVSQHRRHAFYRGLIESDRVLKPEFDDEVSITNLVNA